MRTSQLMMMSYMLHRAEVEGYNLLVSLNLNVTKPFSLHMESHLDKIRLDKSNVQQVQPKTPHGKLYNSLSCIFIFVNIKMIEPVLYCIQFLGILPCN